MKPSGLATPNKSNRMQFTDLTSVGLAAPDG